MALIYKGVTIPAGANITYKGTALQKIIYKGVTVWQRRVYMIQNGVKQIAFTIASGTNVVQYSGYIAIGSDLSGDYGLPNGILFSTSKVDVTNYSKMYVKLYAKVRELPSTSNFGFGLISTQNVDDSYTYGYFRNMLQPGIYDGTYSIDISNVTGAYYIKLKSYNGSYKVYDVYFE